MTELDVIAIDPARIDAMRATGLDEHGSPFTGYAAEGWEPLRCCLRIADKGEQIALIAYTALPEPSPWAETGPAFVHAEQCAGYDRARGLPADLRTGPRILRTYRADRTLDYDDITFVEEGMDVEPALKDLLQRPEVAEVHVRAWLTQCFLYVVRPATE